VKAKRRGYEIVVVGVGSHGPATIYQAKIIRDHVKNAWPRYLGWRVEIRRSAVRASTRAKGRRKR
jgi:hypothetical protein